MQLDLIGQSLALRTKTRYVPAEIKIGVNTEKETDGSRLTGPTLDLELPIFNQGQGEIAKLTAQYRQAQRELEAMAINIRSEVREARDQMVAARDLTSYIGKKAPADPAAGPQSHAPAIQLHAQRAPTTSSWRSKTKSRPSAVTSKPGAITGSRAPSWSARLAAASAANLISIEANARKHIMITRRKFFSGAAALLAPPPSRNASPAGPSCSLRQLPACRTPAAGSITGQSSRLTARLLPWVMKDGVKEFHLIAEPVKREFAPGMMVNCWGYNGQSPGPTIEAVEGDRVRILVTNKLPEPTTVHWHGFILPNGMDGVGGVTQKHIPPGRDLCLRVPARAARRADVSSALR